MTRNDVESEAVDDDGMPEPAAKHKKKAPSKSSAVPFLALVALIAAGAAAYEYRQATVLSDELTQARARTTQLQQQLDTQIQELKSVSTKLQDVAHKNLPVSIIFRPSATGNGLTTFFKNNAPSPVEIGIVLSNPVTERRREVNLNLPANGVVSIGEPEGWVFAPGHHIQVTHAQFGTVEYVVPDKP